MAKTILGIDIGEDTLKLALMKGGRLKKYVTADMPDMLVKEGRVVSTEAMGELLRSVMQQNSIRCREAAVLLSGESVFMRSVSMPRMTAEQLEYNLPYEFRDYITDDLKNYVFDYAMLSTPEELAADPADGGSTMELLAVAAPIALLDDMREIVRKAGMKLAIAAPAACAWANILRRYEKAHASEAYGEYCIVDLGYTNIRMHMFRGDRYVTTRELDSGISSIIQVVAEAYNVDEHLARTYLLTNHEDCQTNEFCVNAYNNISVGLMRAINFYQFSNPESRLADIWLCGGGAEIAALRNSLQEMVSLNIHPVEGLVEANSGKGSPAAAPSVMPAIGITLG